MARYDYRNDYKNMSLEDLQAHLEITKERCLSIRPDIVADNVRRNSYIKERIAKLQRTAGARNARRNEAARASRR